MDANQIAISVCGVSKRYEKVVALNDVHLEVRKGEVFGLLGRNGAGKTTLIEVMEGLRQADQGRVSVLGFDPVRNLDAIKERIGVQLQASSFFRKLRVIEVLQQFHSYYARKADIEKLLELVMLLEKRESFIGDLSGGQRQRLAVALAMINEPEIIFLDEPTTGLDASIRRQLWHTIGEIKKAGATVLLTTHYIEEAERLCDRVCVLEAGRIIVLGTPAELVAGVRGGSAKIYLQTARPLDLANLDKIRTVEASVNGDANYVLEARNTGPALVELINFIEAQHNELLQLQITRASLEDVFIELTGKEIE